MTTTALTTSQEVTPTIQRTNPLLSVMTWELRRFSSNRIFWFQVLGFFCFLLLVQFIFNSEVANRAFSGSVAASSPWGLLQQLPFGSLMLLCMLLPFVNADGVTRDLTRRTHELLMTTAVPNWAYVWGRYLVSLLMSLGLAIVVLAAILVVGWIRHLADSGYPAPEIGVVLLLWVGMVIPATALISSLSFALGTIFPRQSTLIKVILLLGWFFEASIIPVALNLTYGQSLPPSWLSAWDPTSSISAFATLHQYQTAWMNQIGPTTGAAQAQHIFITVENTVPNVSNWFVPHLFLAVLSLLLVALAALTFQRFRNVRAG
jgi:ABC-type transport system involved in multi-copper enzyme maturation permease subunit